jgi:hypothetical protein
MGGRNALVAFNRQIRQLPTELQERECGLIELGRQHARDFDSGHYPSGSGVQRVLTELRKLAERLDAREQSTKQMGGQLDELRTRRVDRLANAAGDERAAVGDDRG